MVSETRSVVGNVPTTRKTVSIGSRGLWESIRKHQMLYWLMLPPLIYFLVFRYGPFWYAQIAFRDFSPRLGVAGSPFVGFKHLESFFNSFYFEQLITNTLVISFSKLLIGIPAAIILAILFHEARARWLQRITQTFTFLPHLLSWVIVSGILLAVLSPSEGLLNQTIRTFGGEPISFLTAPEHFRGVIILSDVWKEVGWSAILYLAALLSIDPTLYEAAAVDGASRLQRIWYISLPGIVNVVVLVMLLRIGHILDAGFGQIYNIYSLPVYSVSDIIDTWVYREGLLNFRFSLATAVGLFKGVIGVLLIVVANRIAKRLTDQSLY